MAGSPRSKAKAERRRYRAAVRAAAKVVIIPLAALFWVPVVFLAWQVMQ